MMNISLKITLHSRLRWTLLLVFILGVTAASYQVLAPVTDSLGDRVRAYSDFSSGYIIMVGDTSPNLERNDFFFEVFMKEHPELYPPETWDERIKNHRIRFQKAWPFTGDDLNVVSQQENIKTVYPLICIDGGYPHPSEHNEYYMFSITAVDVEAADVAYLPFGDIEKGRYLHPDEDAIIIDYHIHEKRGGLVGDCFDVGDTLPLVVDMEVRGFEIVGVYGTPLPSYLGFGWTAVMNMDTIWRIWGVPPEMRRYNGMLIKLQETSRGMDVVSALMNVYPDARVLWQEHKAMTSFKVVESLSTAYGVLRYLVLATSSAMIVTVSLLDLQRRRGELGLLTSIGWRERDVLVLLLTRSLIIGILGAFAGVLLSYTIGGTVAAALVPENVIRLFNLHPIIPDPAYLPYTPALSIALSIVSFTVGYAYYRRATPLSLMNR
jgi:ABC-type lipoprotein release transport system permease subunit